MPAARFEFLSPRSLAETLEILSRYGDRARVLAGGTDLVPKLLRGTLRPEAVVSLRHVEELRGLTFDPDRGLSIGAAVRHAEVMEHPDVRAHYPALVHALSQLATVQVRNMGTIAGNLCNASPCADSAPILLAREARLEIGGPAGSRSLPLSEFFLGPGRTSLAAGELLTAIRVPPPAPRAAFAFRSISGRSRVDMSAASVAAMVRLEDGRIAGARIFLGAVGPTALRAPRAEEVLRGGVPDDALLAQAGEAAAAESKPISDVRATAAWRRRMVSVLARRALAEAAERARA
ncbi:MAG TPA: xanthine dehydrogenase family protein subunit M [Thermoanaerobaculia bacterium]|nr:xanthine dehydrogenase family protein subunit M [Thermoanaerobaculia bacterium]